MYDHEVSATTITDKQQVMMMKAGQRVHRSGLDEEGHIVTAENSIVKDPIS